MNRRAIVILAIAAVALLSVALTVAIARSGRRTQPTGVNPANSVLVQPGQGVTQIISLRITRNGFEPSSLSVPRGEYFLAIHNRTELKSIQVRLDRQAGPRLRELEMGLEKLTWRDKVLLTPGSYSVSVAEDPRSVCEIVVTP